MTPSLVFVAALLALVGWYLVERRKPRYQYVTVVLLGAECFNRHWRNNIMNTATIVVNGTVVARPKIFAKGTDGAPVGAELTPDAPLLLTLDDPTVAELVKNLDGTYTAKGLKAGSAGITAAGSVAGVAATAIAATVKVIETADGFVTTVDLDAPQAPAAAAPAPVTP